MADPGIREAMAGQEIQRAMADPGTWEAMADQGTRGAMALFFRAAKADQGALWPWPGHTGRGYMAPQKKFIGEVPLWEP